MSFFNTHALEEQKEQVLKELEVLFKEAAKIKSNEARKDKYREIADKAMEIEDKTFQAKTLKRFCKQYLGSVKEYTKIREHFDEDIVYESPLIYDEGNCSIFYRGGGTPAVIAEGFLLYIKCSLRDENEETYWILELKRRNGEVETLEMNNKDFSSAKAIKEKLLSMRYSMSVTDGQLTHIHNYLLKQNPMMGRKIIRFGYDEVADCYLFSNGVIWKDKFIEPNDNGLIILDKMALSMPEFDKARSLNHWFRYVPQEDNGLKFTDWYAHFLNAHTAEIGAQVVCHYFFTIFRDIAFHSKKGAPVLFMIGPPSSGKTSMLRQIMSLFGIDSNTNKISLASGITGPAITRLFSKFTNAPLLIDEFSDGHDVEGDLQASWDGNGKTKSKIRNGSYEGLDVDSIPTKSSAMVSSNWDTSNDALFTRTIWIPVMKNTDRDPKRTYSFELLEGYQDKGLSYFTAEFQKYRGVVKAGFDKEYNHIYKNLKLIVNDKEVLDRFFINQALVLTCFILVNRQAKFAMHNKSVDEFHTWLIQNAANQIKEQHKKRKGNSGLSEFFSYIQRAYTNFKLRKDFEYTFIKDRHEIFADGLLAIKFPILYGQFADDYYRKFRKSPPDKKTLENEIATYLDIDVEKIYKQTLFYSNNTMDRNEQDRDAPNNKSSYKNAIRFPYANLVQDFGLDLWSDPNPNP